MEILSFLQFNLITKLFFSVLLLFYFVFVAVVYRQISLMTQILDSKISPLVKTIAAIQIIAVGILFLVGVLLA